MIERSYDKEHVWGRVTAYVTLVNANQDWPTWAPRYRWRIEFSHDTGKRAEYDGTMESRRRFKFTKSAHRSAEVFLTRIGFTFSSEWDRAT